MSVGKALLQIRKQRRLTQGAVATRASIAISYVSRIENGHVQPTMATLGRIAAAMQVPVSAIFQVSESGTAPHPHRCPVSASGTCIGEQIRSEHGRRPAGAKATYGRQEMRILKLADYVALRGTKDMRKALLLVLEAFVQQAG